MQWNLVWTSATALAFLVTAGCDIEVDHNEPRHETRTVDLGKAESVKAEIDMGAGELQVGGGAAQLLNADFTYNRRDWKPDIEYNGNSFRGLLTVKQGHDGGGVHLGNNTYKWDLRFNEKVPLDMVVNCGAGAGNLDLSKLNLRGLEVNMGVGRVEATLPDTPQRAYDVKVHGGIGEAVVHLPTKVGVVAEASGGIGGIQTEGLHKSGDRWVNDAYESGNATTIHVEVHGGIGSIRLLANG